MQGETRGETVITPYFTSVAFWGKILCSETRIGLELDVRIHLELY